MSVRREVITGETPGGLLLNGSWSENGRHDTPLMNLVMELRRDRRAGTVTPEQAANRIPKPLDEAFPNLDGWQFCRTWPECRCSTSAEAMVIYAVDNRVEKFVPEARSDGACAAIFARVLDLLREGYTATQVADFLSAHIDDQDLSPNQRSLVRGAMTDWAARGARRG